jgi:hypothetical protein
VCISAITLCVLLSAVSSFARILWVDGGGGYPQDCSSIRWGSPQGRGFVCGLCSAGLPCPAKYALVVSMVPPPPPPYNHVDFSLVSSLFRTLCLSLCCHLDCADFAGGCGWGTILRMAHSLRGAALSGAVLCVGCALLGCLAVKYAFGLSLMVCPLPLFL